MERSRRKTLVGKVIKKVLDKTATVLVERDVLHPLYKKRVKKSKKYLVHDPNNEVREGYIVEIMSTRPISKRKKWRISKILQKPQVLEGNVQDENGISEEGGDK